METYKKILVVIEPEEKKYIQLHKAAHLARQVGAQITVLLIIYDQELNLFSSLSKKYGGKLKESVIREQQYWLQEQLGSLSFHDLEVNSEVCWHKCQHQAIAEHVSQYNYDLVVKGTKRHSELGSLFITPTDWHLLRECISPILLVKSAPWCEGGRILSAIDVDNNQAFNNEILKKSRFLAQMLQAEHHLVNCYLESDISMYITPPDTDSKVDHEEVKHQHQLVADQMARQYQINQDNIHVMEGLSHDVIPRITKNIDAELVVLGTCSRQGLSEALLGHTAEHVIDEINCDLLALKPDNLVPT
ncbi:MAG: universal stress protein UspE [Gammaproteobacteria bacterium]|nr:universal stress protein UspE [Gammaproteobacteria bacterium]